jgi:hypothetical protein
MKNFFTSMLGALVALFIFTGGAFVLVVGLVGAIAAMGGGEKAMPEFEQGAYLVFDLSTNITDAPPAIDFGSLGGGRIDTLQLRTVTRALRAAAKDGRIAGVFVTGALRPADFGSGFAALKEVRAALAGVKFVALYFSAHWCGPCKRCASSPPPAPPSARPPARPCGGARPRRLCSFARPLARAIARHPRPPGGAASAAVTPDVRLCRAGARCASQACNACSALPPTGTLRLRAPLPVTVTWPSACISRQCARSRLTSSASRRPEEYNNSNMA